MIERLYVREDVAGWRVIYYSEGGAERRLEPDPGPFATAATADAFVEGFARGFDAGVIYEAKGNAELL